MNQPLAARKQQAIRSAPADKPCLPDAHFARALEETLAHEWLSEADEAAYRELYPAAALKEPCPHDR